MSTLQLEKIVALLDELEIDEPFLSNENIAKYLLLNGVRVQENIPIISANAFLTADERDISNKVSAIEKAKEENNTTHLTVPVPMGDIVVSLKNDSAYPGIYVDLKGDNVNDSFRVGETSLMTVEFEPSKRKIQAVVYGNGNSEDPTHIVEYDNVIKTLPLENQIINAKDKQSNNWGKEVKQQEYNAR